jgi:cytochrome c
MTRYVPIAFVMVSMLAGAAAHAAGDALRGARAFQQCIACHSVEPGRHLTGPSLAHAWGSRAGTASGFQRYSEALQRSGLTWNDASLDRWLADPQKLVPDNVMPFSGVKDAGMRADLITYLKAVAENKAPHPPTGGGMMMGGGEPADLRKADAASQVASLRHCRDTYIVGTADGKIHKVWEYNVRLKTDSSERGPQSGKPVVTKSGMRGDRISIVFAAPAEISRFIRETCD